jgi:hypothetical protein
MVIESSLIVMVLQKSAMDVEVVVSFFLNIVDVCISMHT